MNGPGQLPRRGCLALAAAAAFLPPVVPAAGSRCHGTVAHGSIKGSVKLPLRGSNFQAYSDLAATLGRTHVHFQVAEVVGAAYAALATALPDARFVYGETGWPSGGRLRPHRTHQNGLSVDFFVPVRDAAGRSVPLPTSVTRRFGYDIEFDAEARYQDLSIDFAAMAEHLHQLHLAARARGVGIARVIFDPPFLPRLFAAPRGPHLKQNLPFMKGRAWVRHDEHYHVDFEVPCEPVGTSSEAHSHSAA